MTAPPRTPNPLLRSILWITASQVALLLLLGGIFVAIIRQGARPPFLTRLAAIKLAAKGFTRGDGSIHLAGSGSNLPLTRALVEAYNRSHPGDRFVVHQSIGSTGGIRAASDGAVDLGLISRPLTPKERRLDLTVIPYARVAVVVAANKSVPATGLSRADLLAIYRGRRPRWTDGSRVIVLQRERGDSSHRAAGRVLPRFASINEEAYQLRRWRVVFRDHDMQEALLSTPGAVGLFDLGAVVSQELPLKILELDGVAPTPQHVKRGRYPLFKDLGFVCREAPRGKAARLIQFVFSEQGQAVIGSKGYIPLARGAR